MLQFILALKYEYLYPIKREAYLQIRHFNMNNEIGYDLCNGYSSIHKNSSSQFFIGEKSYAHFALACGMMHVI